MVWLLGAEHVVELQDELGLGLGGRPGRREYQSHDCQQNHRFGDALHRTLLPHL